MMRSRKAQLTVFIVVGIVLLFSAALILYIRQSLVEYQPPSQVVLEQVPTELQPLQAFVTSCLKSTTTDAIRKVGLQGGYIDTSRIQVNDQDPTSGEGISMPPQSGLKVPYWYFMRSTNTCGSGCEFDTKQPSLHRDIGNGDSIEEQIDLYVKEKLSSCTLGFTNFKQFKIDEGNIKITTTITNSDVLVEAEYPLTVKIQDRIEKISKFVSRISVNLAKMYDLAADLTQRQIGTGYLDALSINTVSAFSKVDKNYLPPVAETTFFKGKQISWTLTNVKSMIEELLSTYSDALQATNTANFQGNLYTGNDELAKGLYSFFILPLNKTYKADVEFAYIPWWPTYVSVTPRQGEMIRPESAEGFGGQWLSFLFTAFGINQYKFSYDISYPVLITLTDQNALGGEGFVFQFALESNLRNNEPMKTTSTLITISSRSLKTMVCKPENFKSAEVTIDVTNSYTKLPLEGVLVYFAFGKESCLIGETEIINGSAVVRTKMPVGVGNLIVSKENYLSKAIMFGTSLNQTKQAKIELDPIVELKVEVARIPIVPKVCSGTSMEYKGTTYTGVPDFRVKFPGPCTWGVNPTEPGLTATEQATITFLRIKENPAQEEFSSSVLIKGNENTVKKIKLVPGNYEIRAQLFDNQKTIIPEGQSCTDQGVFGGGIKCEKLDAVSFDVFPKGGLSFNSYPISTDDLKVAKSIIINLLSVPDGYSRNSDGTTNMMHYDLEQMGKLEQYSIDYADLLTIQYG